jgi:hypothetical protein
MIPGNVKRLVLIDLSMNNLPDSYKGWTVMQITVLHHNNYTGDRRMLTGHSLEVNSRDDTGLGAVS